MEIVNVFRKRILDLKQYFPVLLFNYFASRPPTSFYRTQKHIIIHFDNAEFRATLSDVGTVNFAVNWIKENEVK